MKTENGERIAASKRAKSTCLDFCSERKPLQAYNVGLKLKTKNSYENPQSNTRRYSIDNAHL